MWSNTKLLVSTAEYGSYISPYILTRKRVNKIIFVLQTAQINNHSCLFRNYVKCNLWPQRGILWLMLLPVYNDYCKSNIAGFPELKQCMLYLYPLLLAPRVVQWPVFVEADILPSSPFTVRQAQHDFWWPGRFASWSDRVKTCIQQQPCMVVKVRLHMHDSHMAY